MKRSDPRKSSNEHSVVISSIPWNNSSSSSGEEPDYMALLSLLFGILGVLLKYRIFIWQAFLFGIMSVVNMKTKETGFQQIFSSMSICIMGMVMAYVGPQARLFY